MIEMDSAQRTKYIVAHIWLVGAFLSPSAEPKIIAFVVGMFWLIWSVFPSKFEGKDAAIIGKPDKR
jgi:hypothetical protein